MGLPDDRLARAAARAGWPGAKTTLGDEREDLSATTSVEERLAMMWELAIGAWALTGAALPSYPRAEIPGRVLRPEGR